MNKSGKNVYLAMDGDDMGSTVEDVLLENDTETAETLSNNIHHAFETIEAYVVERGGDVIFRGGDNILFSAPDKEASNIAEGVRDIYLSITDHSATVGVGEQPLDAHKALVVGKNSGKDQTVVWGNDQEPVYEEIKEKQKGIQECVEEAESDDLAPSIKYKAENALNHYRRLVGVGYGQKEALEMIESTYHLGESFRDMLVKKKKNLLTGKTPLEQQLRDGEEQYDKIVQNLESPSPEPSQSQAMEPVIGQKVVGKKDLGRVAWVGPRFISVRWLSNNNLERFGRKRFLNALKESHYVLVPKIRVAEVTKKRAKKTKEKKNG